MRIARLRTLAALLVLVLLATACTRIDDDRGVDLSIDAPTTTEAAEVDFADDDVLVFGSESDGLGSDRLREFAPDNVLTIPMRPDNRSLNLANAVSVVVYEAWRQAGFAGSVRRTSPGLTQETLTSPPFDS